MRNNLWDSVGLLFCETGKLISEHEKSLVSVSTIIFKYATWMSTSLLCGKPSLPTPPTPKPTSSPTLCSVWEKWEMILLRLGRIKSKGIREKLFQGYESNRRNADGVRVENIPRNHNVGPPRAHSKSNDRHTV